MSHLPESLPMETVEAVEAGVVEGSEVALRSKFVPFSLVRWKLGGQIILKM